MVDEETRRDLRWFRWFRWWAVLSLLEDLWAAAIDWLSGEDE